MSQPMISPAQISAGASAESYARGVSYYHDGAVADLVLRGDTLQAEVEGGDTYLVRATFGTGGVTWASCSCPYSQAGWCKHIVAALLAYAAAQPGEVLVRPPLAELLAGLDRERLVALLLRLADEEPGLADRVDTLATAPAPVRAFAATPAAPAPIAAPRPPAEAAFFRRQVRHAFSGLRYDDYFVAGGIVTELAPLLAQVRTLVEADDAATALPLLESFTEEFSGCWFEYDDSDGELGSFFDDLARLWAEALLTLDLPRGERAAWARRLDAWRKDAADYGVDGFDIALRAAEEGWDAPWLTAALRGEPVGPQFALDWAGTELLPIRLTVLRRKGLVRDALALAATGGLHREQALALAQLGRVAESVALAREHLRRADEALDLAQALHDLGQDERAIAVAEHGLGLEPPRAPLGGWLFERAAAMGRRELALRAAEIVLGEAPSLLLYQQVQAYSGEDWPSKRERVLRALRGAWGLWGVARELVDIYLNEGLIDEAIKVVSRPEGSDELMRVMGAAKVSHPDWVIAMATAKAEAIADAGRSASYGEAVEWLHQAREVYLATGRQETWTTYLQTLRAKHARKYKLMELLTLMENPHARRGKRR